MIEVPEKFKVPVDMTADHDVKPDIVSIPVFNEESESSIEVRVVNEPARFGTPAVREVVVLESHPNPTRVIGHPSNPVTNQAEAYANSLREDA